MAAVDIAFWPQLTFVGGKGGVGKTTCAAALALGAAESGRRVLVISTDPAHSLGDALGRRLSATPRVIAPRLQAAELDAERAMSRWLEPRLPALRLLAERGTYLDGGDLDRILSLSLPGVDELISLIAIAELAAARAWDEIVVDMAPTGHALELLAMPSLVGRFAEVLDGMNAKHRYMAGALGGRHDRDGADAFIDELADKASRMAAALRDVARSRCCWVLLAEPLALAETAAAIAALARAGIGVRELWLNRLAAVPRSRCPTCTSRAVGERAIAAAARARFPGLPLRVVPALDAEPIGLRRLGTVARALGRAPIERSFAVLPRHVAQRGRVLRTRPDWPERLAPEGRRLLLFTGKGGVGKTTCAATAALLLARRRPGARALLLSVDPAHSLGGVLGQPVGDEPSCPRGAPANLVVRELDALTAFAQARDRYRDEVDAFFDGVLRRGPHAGMDASFDRRVVRDLVDLAPPGIDEVFGIASVLDALADDYELVVVDTAPTGHALRLLETPERALAWIHALLELLLKYRRALGLGRMAKELLSRSGELKRLRALLSDPRAAAAVVVTRPATLPGEETVRLTRALGALHVPTAALIVNAYHEPGGRCTACRRRASADARALAHMKPRRGASVYRAPASYPPPIGARALAAWAERWQEGTA